MAQNGKPIERTRVEISRKIGKEQNINQDNIQREIKYAQTFLKKELPSHITEGRTFLVDLLKKNPYIFDFLNPKERIVVKKYYRVDNNEFKTIKLAEDVGLNQKNFHRNAERIMKTLKEIDENKPITNKNHLKQIEELELKKHLKKVPTFLDFLNTQPQSKEIIEHYYGLNSNPNGFSLKEIGEKLGISKPSAARIVQNVRKEIKEQLNLKS